MPEYPRTPFKRVSDIISPKVDGDSLDIPTGRGATLVVAANDSSTLSKQQADYVCDGTADNVEIQAAIDALPAVDGEIVLFEGTYNIAAQIEVTKSLVIRGINKPTLNWNVLATDMLYCHGSVRDTVNVAVADISEGDITVTVDDASSVVEGDLIVIYDDVIWNTFDYPTWKTGEVHEVHSISGNTITFFEGTLHDYTIANNAKVIVISPISVDLDNLKTVGGSETDDYSLISLTYTKDSSITNCILDKGGNKAIYIDYSHNIIVQTNTISNCIKAGLGYGVSISNASAHIIIINNKISNCRHCTAGGGTGGPGQVRDYVVKDNHLSAGIHSAIDAHAIVESLVATDNIISANNQYACSTGAKVTRFNNNKIVGGSGVSIRDNTINISCVVQNNCVEGCSYNFTDHTAGANNSIDFVHITNNILTNAIYYLAYISKAASVLVANNSIDKTDDYYGLVIVSATSGLVSDNLISDCYRCGISMDSCSNLRIEGNVVKNSDRRNAAGELSEAGIRLTDCSNLIVTNNSVYDDTPYQRYAIKEYGTSDNNVVRDNYLRGATITPLSLIGLGSLADAYEQYSDLLMDVLAVSATHIRSNEDLSAATPITFTLDAQPDVPRTLSWSFDTHAQITEYDMEVIGIDAKGNTITETWDETAGWSGETSNAFATITSIKMTSRTGTGAADTMDIGITDVLGLSNIIYETSDVFKIKKNNANATVATAQVNTTYDTYDMSVIGLGAGDDFTIWYKSNLNIII